MFENNRERILAYVNYKKKKRKKEAESVELGTMDIKLNNYIVVSLHTPFENRYN